MGGNLPSLVATSAIGAAFWETVFLPFFKQNYYVDAFPTYFVVNSLVISLGIHVRCRELKVRQRMLGVGGLRLLYAFQKMDPHLRDFRFGVG
jgi:hypothetical protein